jgi:cell division initiation protein
VKVTPLDIRRKEFKRSMRGYSDEEVDVFLDEVADEFERLFQENMELQDRMQRLEEQIAGHVQIKDALEKTLIAAQMQSDEMRANARKESELILGDAELKARHIVNDSYGETQRVQQALIQLKHLEEDFRFKFRSLLEGHLKLLNEAPITVRGAGALAPRTVSDAETPVLTEAPVLAEAPVLTEAFTPAEAPLGEFSLVLPPADSEPVDSTIVEEPASRKASSAPEDDIPTEETEFGAADSGLAPLVADIATESVGVAQKAVEEEPPVRGFFFGRGLDNGDDAFTPQETATKEKGRDFEW